MPRGPSDDDEFANRCRARRCISLWLAWDSFYVVGETQQALVVRQGLPIGAVSEPGLRFKLALLDAAIFFRSGC